MSSRAKFPVLFFSYGEERLKTRAKAQDVSSELGRLTYEVKWAREFHVWMLFPVFEVPASERNESEGRTRIAENLKCSRVRILNQQLHSGDMWSTPTASSILHIMKMKTNCRGFHQPGFFQRRIKQRGTEAQNPLFDPVSYHRDKEGPPKRTHAHNKSQLFNDSSA